MVLLLVTCVGGALLRPTRAVPDQAQGRTPQTIARVDAAPVRTSAPPRDPEQHAPSAIERRCVATDRAPDDAAPVPAWWFRTVRENGEPIGGAVDPGRTFDDGRLPDVVVGRDR